MKRYVMFCSSAHHWMELGIDLRDKSLALPSLWIGDDAHYDLAKREFGQNLVKQLSELRYAAGDEVNISYDGQLAEYLVSDRYVIAKDLCLKMMDRLDDIGAMSRLDREVWYHNVVIWTLKHFSKYPPDFLLMSEAPHNHAQYAIYEICRYLKIPILKFSAFLPVPILVPYQLINGVYEKLDYKDSSDTLKHLQDNLSSYISETTRQLNDLDTSADPKHLRLLKKKSASISFVASEIKKEFKNNFRFIKYPRTWFVRGSYKSENPMGLWPLIVQLIVAKRRSILRREMGMEIDSNKDIESLNYVYYPLHYEPERTTNPDGGQFQDQLINLLLLRKLLPGSINIVVKEHPSQFLRARTGYRGRSPLFYKQIKNIKGLIFLDASVPSTLLIRESIAVATISGTVGFEAACLGKKCILFGETWFKGMPNVFDFQSINSFDELLEQSTADVHEIDNYFADEVFRSGMPGFQNLSATPRISEFLTDNFFKDQRAALLSCCTNFINEHVS